MKTIIPKETLMDISKGFVKYDPKSEAEWFDYNEMKFLIAPMGSPYQKKKITELFTLKEAMGLEEYGALTFGDVKANIAIGQVYSLYAKSVVLDWENVEEKDKPLKFNPDKVHELMMEHDEFASWVIEHAQALRKKRAEAKAELTKN